MHVGLDLAACGPASGGIGRYAEELTRALLGSSAADERVEELVLFTGDRLPAWLLRRLQAPAAGRPSSVHVETGSARRGHAALRANLVLGPRLARTGVEVFHSPDTLGAPLTCGRDIALVATVHDLIPWFFPQAVTPRHRWIRCAILPMVVRRAERLIVDSHATARDLLQLFPEAANKVRVVYLGVEPRFAPARPDQVTAVRARLGLPSSYLLFVGTLSPRKNLDGLVSAYALLQRGRDDLPHLVIAGAPGWLWAPVMQKVNELRLQRKVIFCGFVQDDDLPALLTGAMLFVLPSRYEGFGLPILEAMACGTPVLTSDRSSLPEVAGEAAVCVDPEQPAAIAEGIRRLLDDSGYRTELGRRGLERARAFPWTDTARNTVAVYREALGRI